MNIIKQTHTLYVTPTHSRQHESTTVEAVKGAVEAAVKTNTGLCCEVRVRSLLLSRNSRAYGS